MKFENKKQAQESFDELDVVSMWEERFGYLTLEYDEYEYTLTEEQLLNAYYYYYYEDRETFDLDDFYDFCLDLYEDVAEEQYDAENEIEDDDYDPERERHYL